MPISSRRGILASAIAVAAALAVAGAPAAQAAHRPAITVSGGVTQPVFSYADAIREYVRVESSVDSDDDGKKDLIRVDIVRPKESGPGFKVPVIMDESPYYDKLRPGERGRAEGLRRRRQRSQANAPVLRQLLRAARLRRPRRRHDRDHHGVRRLPRRRRAGRRARRQGGRRLAERPRDRVRPRRQGVKADWTNGRKGTIGKSYDGTLANGVAATGVAGLDTIVPIPR